MDSKAKLISILSHLKDSISAPSDIVMRTGLPRYEVLGAFHVLEALGIVSIVHSRSNYKLYTLSEIGKKILETLLNGGDLEDLIESREPREEDRPTLYNPGEELPPKKISENIGEAAQA
ncbi:MAG: hypothetical protein QXQ57_00380 [Sulfolobales archaeon]